MIWRSQYHNKIARIIDFVTALLAYTVTYYLSNLLYKIYPAIFPAQIILRDIHYFIVCSLGVSIVYIYQAYGAYSYQRFTSLLSEYGIVFRSVLINTLISFSIVFMLRLIEIPRTFFVLSFIVAIIFFSVQKTFLYYIASYIREQGKDRKKVILIGTGTRAVQFIETVKENFGWGLDIVGILTDEKEMVGKQVCGINVIDTYNNLENVLINHNPEEVVITISTKQFDIIEEIFLTCEKIGVFVRLNSDYFGHMTKNIKVENVFGLNIISFYPTRQADWELIIKRLMDIIVSSIFLILLIPVFIIIMTIIYIQDGLPVFYEWKIVGYQRKPIVSWKFRTMVKNADELKKNLLHNNEMTGPMFKLTNDPRILPFGNFLRKYSLDELPQLFSVLKGDLSLVGPRPPLQYEFKEFDFWHRRKLSVKPGLTCLWQVSGRNKISNFDDWAKLDLEYIDNWSIWLDILILLKTIPAIFTGRGAK
jgi:exopolysaccharide biosynthesis polyprenyl glycosylphosphotransferase